MSRQKAAHHRGTHQRRAEKVVAAANADPFTRCHRCGLWLAEHKRHRNGKPAFWTAGHVIDGLVDGPLAAEASTCNFSHGARLGNLRRRREREARSDRW
jgi:hypothetical protein